MVRLRSPAPYMGAFPSGQRGQTVNLLLDSFGGPNPPAPTKINLTLCVRFFVSIKIYFPKKDSISLIAEDLYEATSDEYELPSSAAEVRAVPSPPQLLMKPRSNITFSEAIPSISMDSASRAYLPSMQVL